MFLSHATGILVLSCNIFLGGIAWANEAYTTEQRNTENTDYLENVITRSTTQVGYDYWDIQRTILFGSEPQLFLADSTPQWKYRHLSPWISFNGSLQAGTNTLFTLKFRANQSSDLRLDEFSSDYAVSPSLGFRAGVLDYKTSWCRRYELDSPWVRENDPFCNVRTTEKSIAAAPGLQGGFKPEVQHLPPSKVRRCKVPDPSVINSSSLRIA